MVGRWLNTNKMDASILHGSNSGDLGERYCSRYGWFPAAAKRILVQFTRDVNETLAYETETFGFWSETKTFLQFHETETSDFCHETRPRPRPCKAETETFFETFNLQDCAKTMNDDVQIKTIYIKQYRYLLFYSV